MLCFDELPEQGIRENTLVYRGKQQSHFEDEVCRYGNNVLHNCNSLWFIHGKHRT